MRCLRSWSVILASLWSLRLGHAHPLPPQTSAERAKSTVDPKRQQLLGGGSADTPGHERPMQEQPNFTPVTVLEETPSWEVFYKEYVRTNTPVAIKGHTARTQPAFKLWTDEYLMENWGTMKVGAEVWKNEDRNGPQEELPLKKLLKRMYSEKYKDQYYSVIPFDDDAKAKADFTLPEPVRCKEILPQSLTLWMSAGGTTSVLHHDDGENLLMLLDGTKEVMLVHQDQAQNIYAHAAKHRGTSAVHQDGVDHVRFPNFKNVHWVKATLEAGDTLYIPHSYWHQVNSKGRNLAANFWFGHKQDYHWWNPEKYDVISFGRKGSMPFDDLKNRSLDMLPCSPLPDGETMQKMKFVDEGKYKEYLAKSHKKMLKAQKKAATLKHESEEL